MKIVSKLFFLFFLLPLPSFCQKDTVFNEVMMDSVILKYSETPTIKDTATNFFIETLSKSIPKIRAYTQYSFSYNYYIAITNAGKATKAGRNLNISVWIKKGKCKGDVLYKSFSIADVLLPDVFDLTLNIENSAGKSLQPIAATAIKLINGESNLNTFPFHDSLVDPKYKVTATNKLFYYNDSAYAAFKKKIAFINDYYNSEFVIAAALEKLEKMNLGNVEMMKIYEIEVKEVEKTADDLKNKDYTGKLNLGAFDPIDFAGKYKNLVQQTAKQRFIINNMVSSIDNVYYKKGCEYYEENNMAEALKYFEKSIESNAYYSPSYYQMATIYYGQDSIDKAIEKLSMLLAKLNPDQATLKKGLLLGNTIYSLCITKGEELEAAENYNDALTWLSKAQKFCTAVPTIVCSETLQKNIAKGHFGIYSSFCTVSQMAINKEIYDIAEIYTLKAKAYQKEFSSDIIFSTEADNLLVELVKGLTAKGLHLNTEKRYDSALVMLEKAGSLCNDFPDIKCSDKLQPAIRVSRKGAFKIYIAKAAQYIADGALDKADSAITYISTYRQLHAAEITNAKAADSLGLLLKKKWYDKYIAEGTGYLRNRDGMKALDNFELAKNLEKTFAIARDSALDSLIVASAEPYILNVIESGCVKTWGNELDKARAIKDSAKTLQVKYALGADTTINSALADLDSKIVKQQCKNAQESYNENYRFAYQKIALRNYTAAVDYFAKCLAAAADNFNCGVKDSMAKLGREKYMPAATFQKKLHESDSLAAAGKYTGAIKKYLESMDYYAARNMQGFGLTSVPLKEYLKTSDDTNYILACANYYFDISDYPNTFYFLEILRKRYFSETTTFTIQQALAARLAPADYAKNPRQKPSAPVNSYTGGNAWYSAFKKAYFIEWKALKKNDAAKKNSLLYRLFGGFLF